MINLARRFDAAHDFASLLTAAVLGIVLGVSVIALATAVPAWSTYRLAFVLLLGFAYIGVLLTGNIRKALLVSLVLAIPLNFAFDPLGEVVMHAGGAPAGVILYPYDFPLAALLAILVIDALTKRKPIEFSSVDVVAIVLIVWTVVSIFNSSEVRLSFFETMRVAKLYVLARVVASSVRGRDDLKAVLLALLLGLIIQSVITVAQYTMGTDLNLGLFTVGELRRVSGTVGWPNTLGAYAATVLSVGIALWMFRINGRSRVLIGIACIAGFFPLLLSYSRGAWISLVAGVGLIVFLGWRGKRIQIRTAITRMGVIMLLASVVGFAYRDSITTRLRGINSGMEVLTDRMKLNEVALNMIRAEPIFGIGVNTFVDVMVEYDTTGISAYFPQPVHNVYLLLAAETGIIGLGIFLLLLFVVFREGLQIVWTANSFLAGSVIGILSGLLVLMVNNLADVHLKTDVLFAHFWLLIGLVIASRRISHRALIARDRR